MNYQESLDYLKSLAPTLERPTMTRIKLFFEELGRPQNKVCAFHVGGTNGKGSVSTFLASMLRSCGKKVGKFTGPHLLKFNERIVVDGADIDDATFAEVASAVLEQSLAFAARHPEMGPLTWFEFLTAMAVHYFNREAVDVAVFEVGLGGRFDATNALDNVIVSTITNVDLDHMQLLGSTVKEIAFEKAGIIKGAPLVTAAGGDALAVLEQKAAELQAPLIALHNPSGNFSASLLRDFKVDLKNAAPDFEKLVRSRLEVVQNGLLARENLDLKGAYQRLNALTALLGLCVSPLFDELAVADRADAKQDLFVDKLRLGLDQAYWPGRYEIVESLGQIWDGAHNPHGARALRMSLDEMFAGRKFAFIFAAFQNKDVHSLLSELVRPGDSLLAPRLTGERPFHNFEQIQAECQALQVDCLHFENFGLASDHARRLIGSDRQRFAKLAIVTGSFATVREAKSGVRTAGADLG